MLRRIDVVPWWTQSIARLLFQHERNALARTGELGIAPTLLFAGRRALVRGWINGVEIIETVFNGALSELNQW